MSIESYIPDEAAESGSQSVEISEKYKEAAKKASKGIKRTQKDEKKARKYDFLLANFLVEMILKKKYDDLLEDLFSCLDAGYGTNFLLGILSLVYMPISHEIRKHASKLEIDFHYERSIELIQFDDHHLPPAVRVRVNQWIEDMESVMTLEPSSIISHRSMNLVVYDDKIRTFTTNVFSFFFRELNISISDAKAKDYSEYILGELQKTIQKILPKLDEDISEKEQEI